MVLYDLKKPQATSLRFLLGHNEQIIETSEPDILQSVLGEKGRGYVIAVKDTTLPALPGKFSKKQLAENGFSGDMTIILVFSKGSIDG
jgi:hypothetical protein